MAMAAGTTIYIDQIGDVRIKVGEDYSAVTFVACSRTLARNSRFFKQLLYGGFTESKQAHEQNGADWIVSLPEDNPQGIKLLFRILHAQFDDIPKNLSVEDLYQLTVLTDKYALTRILRPWARDWSDMMTHSVGDARKRLWIAWELGNEILLQKAAYELVVDLDITPSLVGMPYNYGMPEPPGVYDLMKPMRLEIISKLFSYFEYLLYTDVAYASGGPEYVNFMLQVLEEMKALLRSLKLEPIPDAVDIQESFNSLLSRLGSLQITDPEDHASEAAMQGIHHVIEIMSEDYSPGQKSHKIALTESMLHHLRGQAETLGILEQFSMGA